MRNYTILIVDYEPRSIERTRRPLESAGFRVEVANDGVAGLAAFESLKPDLVLVEAMLPKKHGFEVCQDLKKTPQGKRTPILVTTAVYRGRRYRAQAMHVHGADDYIEKPIDDAQMLEIVRRHLRAPANATAEPADAASPVPVSPAPEAEGIDDDVIEIVTDEDDAPPPPPPAPRAPEPPKMSKAQAPAPRVEARKPAPPVAKPARPASPSAPSAVGDMTEDEIMARLDAILPSDPGMSSLYTADQPAAPAEDAPVPLSEAPEAYGADAKLQAIGVVEPPSLGESFHEIDLSADVMAPEPIAPRPVLPPFDDPIPSAESFGDLAEMKIPPLGNVPQAPPAQVLPFEEPRSRREKKAANRARQRGQGSSPTQAATAPAMRPKSEPIVAQAPAFEMDPRPAEVESFPMLDSRATGKKFPLWVVGLLVVLAAAAGWYYFLRGSDAPAPSSEPAADVPAPVPLAQRPAPPVQEPPAPAEARAPSTAAETPSVPASQPAEPPATAAAKPTVAPPKPAHQSPVPQDYRQPAAPKPVASAPAPSSAAPAKSADIDTSDLGGLDAVPVQALSSATAPTRPEVTPGQMMTLGQVDVLPQALQRKLPGYTARARAMRQSGTVLMEVLVDENGVVQDVRVLKGIPGSDLNDAAANAAREWTYSPAKKGGVPVKVWRPEQVVFKP